MSGCAVRFYRVATIMGRLLIILAGLIESARPGRSR